MDQEGYKTKNINIGAYLYSSGLQLLNTLKVDKEVFFIFTPKDKAEQLVEKYFAGTARISPREFVARLNDLRDLIFSGGKNA